MLWHFHVVILLEAVIVLAVITGSLRVREDVLYI
jgi:hypothetical protein